MGRPTHRKSINAAKAKSASMFVQNLRDGRDMPPCVLAMILNPERAMQRALTSLSHVPWIGIHASRMSRHVAVLTTAKKAMRMYVYL